MPLISVITPTFNTAGQLRKAIESVAGQTYKKWEHIIIDGGSTDNTMDIVREYPILRWISEPDNGIYDAMNKGISMAKGEWLYFLGSDDYLHANTILSEVAPFLTDDHKVVYGKVLNLQNKRFFEGAFDARRILKENICHQGIFFNRALFDISGTYDLRYPVLSDWDHNMRWLLHKSIKKLYLDFSIACYAADGISNTTDDPEFHRNKRLNFVKYAKKSLPSTFVRMIALQELKRAVVKISPRLFYHAGVSYIRQFWYMIIGRVVSND